MPRKPTVNRDNIFCKARLAASEYNDEFSSRAKASAVLGISESRLTEIESDRAYATSDEVVQMARKYDAPSLCSDYCMGYCAIGRDRRPQLMYTDLEKIVLNLLYACRDVEQLQKELLGMSRDGVIDGKEKESFEDILKTLRGIAAGAEALELWASKN